MDIFVERASSPFDRGKENKEFLNGKKRRERRRARKDRRREVNEGLIVSLSVHDGDRRSGSERRQNSERQGGGVFYFEHPLPKSFPGTLSVII